MDSKSAKWISNSRFSKSLISILALVLLSDKNNCGTRGRERGKKAKFEFFTEVPP